MKYFYSKSLFFFIAFFAFSIVSFAQNGNVNISSPANLAGDYDAQLAGFIFCEFESISGELALAEDDFGTATACNANGDLSDLSNSVDGKIAVMDRGNCAFTEKVYAAQQAGAIAVIMCNNEEGLLTMSGEDENITIPSLLLSMGDCELIKADLANGIEATLSRTGVVDEFSDDVVFWGGDGKGNFESGLGDWTTEGITDAAHVWTWSDDAAISAKSSCGAALFDLQAYQIADGLDPENPGSPPYNQYTGELISPSIDLSSLEAAAMKFYQFNLGLNGTTSYATSIDGGATWSDAVEIETANEQGEPIETEIIRIPIPELAGESDVKIKFIIDGDFFFWVIDDFEIVELRGNNVSMTDAFYTPIAYGFPKAHADADTFFFFATVRNTGGRVLDNVRLDVSVTYDATGEEVFSTSGTRSDIAIGETTTVEADNLFVPVDLPVGRYIMRYDLIVLDASETIRTDNSSTKIFEITEDIFSKEPGPLDNGFYSGSRPGGEWAAATIYRMSNNAPDYFATNAITSISSNAEVLTDNFIDVFLVKLNGGINISDYFEFQDTDLAGHPSFDIISQNTHVFTTEENGELISIPFSSSGQSVPLEPGETYMVILRFDGSQAGAAAVPNEELFLAYSSDPRVANKADGVGFISDFVVSKDQGQWFSGFSGDPAPVLRMQVEFVNDIDDIPLPAGSFLVYPNPTRDLLQVEFDFEESMDATVVLASIDGKIIQVEKLNNVSKRNIELNVSDLSAGTYILKAYTEKGSSTQKVIITE